MNLTSKNGSTKNGIVKAVTIGTTVALGGLGIGRAVNYFVDKFADRIVSIITQDPYEENMFEAVSQFRRMGVQNVIEIDLRAHTNDLFLRPLGSPKQMPSFDRLMFNMAQLDPLPTAHNHPVNTRVTIGPRADMPLTINMPIMVGGMGYGVSLSKEAKLAIARATSRVGIPTNTGEGPFLPDERAEANKLIVQYHRGNWMNIDTLTKADLVEIHIGQGASGSVGGKLQTEKVDEKLLKEMNIPPGEDAILLSSFPEMASGHGLKPIVDRARDLSKGVPVIVKIGASHTIESDLTAIFEAGADGVLIDGAQAGSGQSSPITQDDFGIPTLFALVRARRHLNQIDRDRTMSLIVSGGLFTPGDFLKCLALGADAVSIATAPMLALMAGQQQKATPAEPPTQVILYQGNSQHTFDIQKATDALTRFFKSCHLEMEYGVRQLGKDDVRSLTPDDLCALDDNTAKIVGVEVAYKLS